MGLEGGPELLPELDVHVLRRVDPEAVDADVGDPRLEDVDHPVDDLRAFGEEVVEPEEVAVLAVLPDERGVATVVVHRPVVQPGRHLDGLVGGRPEDRVVREGVEVERRERVRARVIAVVELVAVGVDIREGRLVPVRVRPFLVVDHVGGVVRDDVEEDLDPAVVGGVDERLELGVRAEVRVDLRVVRDPVAVIAGRRIGARALDRPVLEDRRHPDRRCPERLDVVEPVQQAGDVAAVVEALVGGVEAGGQPVAGQAALVVGRVAVVEPVGQDEVEDLFGQVVPQRAKGEGLVRGVGRVVVSDVDGDRVGGAPCT